MNTFDLFDLDLTNIKVNVANNDEKNLPNVDTSISAWRLTDCAACYN